MNFAQALTALMDEQGVSGCELARRVHCDRSYIYRLRKGKQPPSAKIAGRCDEVLGADGTLMALTDKPKPPLTRRSVLAAGLAVPLLGSVDTDRLAWAERHASRVDGATVRSLTEVLAAQRHAEDALGSAALLKPVEAQLAAVENLTTEARGPVRLAVLDVAQQWAQFAAWLNVSTRHLAAARARCRQTLELAAEAGDATMTATVLHNRGWMALLAGKPGPMIGLAQAAQRDPRAAANERALAADIEARGHAMTGDAATAERKLGEAQDLAAQGQPARWSYWATPAYFDCMRGAALGYLAHIDRYRAQAIEALTAGYVSLGPDLARSEWAAAYLMHRAAVHARGGEVDEACADALRVVPIWRQANSTGLREMLAEVHADLAARYPGDARVKELADAFA